MCERKRRMENLKQTLGENPKVNMPTHKKENENFQACGCFSMDADDFRLAVVVKYHVVCFLSSFHKTSSSYGM